MKHKKTKKNKNKSKASSRDICTLSSKFLKNLTTPDIYNKYETYITQNTQQFTNSQLTLLNDIFKTKAHLDHIGKSFSFTYEHKPLDASNAIPPFIDIFRYIITKPEVITKLTHEEQNILKTHLSSTYSNHDIYLYLSKSPIGKKILTIYYSLSETVKQELRHKFPSIELHKLLINSFTDYEILADLESKIKNVIIFSIKWKGIKYDNFLYLFTYEKLKKHNTNHTNRTNHTNHTNRTNHTKHMNNIHIKKLGNEIMQRILFFNMFLNIDKLPERFIIFMTDKKKEIDENVVNHMHFKTINVNTAVTNGLDIIIYREQELLKSIFHELIHFHNLDFRTIPLDIVNYLIKTHNIKSDNEYLLYECVTETLANLLNNIFVSRNIKLFQTNLIKEIMFSTIQAVKILKVCGYKNWNEFSHLDTLDTTPHTTSHKLIHKQFTQDSCVLSYYILKLYIMINLDTYFKNNLDNKLKFIQTNESFNNLKHIFDISRKNENVVNIMNNLLQNMSRQISGKMSVKYSKKDKIKKTLRMTCLEKSLFSNNSL